MVAAHFPGLTVCSLYRAQAAWQRVCCTARNEGGEGEETGCWCGDCFPSGRAGAWRQGSKPCPQRELYWCHLVTLIWKEPCHCVQFPLWRQPLRFPSCENRQQFHLSRHSPVCISEAWRLCQALSCFSMPSQPAPASSSICPGGLCHSPTSQMLAFRRCPGKQPCSVLYAMEGSTHLSTSVLRECDFADLCPASSLSTSSAVPWPSSTQPPGKGRRQTPRGWAQKCRLLYGFIVALTIRGHKQDRVLGCAKSPKGG